jgi:hypothetical protein
MADDDVRLVPKRFGRYRAAFDFQLIHIRASKVGENGIKPDILYTLNAQGEFEEFQAKEQG